MPNPMISIIIPVYNGSNYLREAIDSALAQTYDNYEVIVVNDGSNDGGATEEIALSYGERIRYFKKENGGVATALNLGIGKMRGEYFSWLCPDDRYMPEKLSAQWDALRDRGTPRAIAYSDYDVLDMETGTVSHAEIKRQYPPEKLENSVFPVLYGLIHGCSLLIHKSHFERVGLFDEMLRTAQDYDLWFRMFRGQELVFVPRSLICGRCHPEQGTRVISSFQQEEGCFYYKAYMELSPREQYKIFGHPAFLYRHVEAALRRCGVSEDCREAAAGRFRDLRDTVECAALAAEFCRRFRVLREGTKKICIFCCGQYGWSLRNALADLGITVDFFSDNDLGLWGKSLDGCRCVSPEELGRIQEETLIIVSAYRPFAVLEQLRDMRHVTSKQAIESIL